MKLNRKINFLLLLLSSVTFAASRSNVVKVFSHPCILPSSEFAGSGTLFNFRGTTYVITSEHVVLHKNEGICHSFKNDNVTQPLTLVAADWGNGLALLKSTTVQKDAPSFESFFEFNLEVEDKVYLTGYPRRTSELISDQGYVLLTSSTRPVLALVNNLIEIKGGHVEFGMSGGALLTKDKQKYLGLISHQALVAKNEGATNVEEIEINKPLSDHALIIPARTIKDWLYAVLTQTITQPEIVRNASIQVLENKDVVFTRGLKFEAYNSSKDGGIGGMDGAGRIGGMDGAGRVGGNEKITKDNTGSISPLCINQNSLSVKISLDSDNLKAFINIPLRDSWFEMLKSRVLTGKNMCVTQFIKQSGYEIQNVRIESIAHFFSLLKNEELSPVTYQWDANSNILETEVKIARGILNKFGASLLKRVITLENLKETRNSIEIQAFLLATKKVGQVLTSENPEILSLEILSGLSGSHFEQAREKLFSIDFDLMVEVMGLVPEVGNVLRKVKLP